MVTFEPIIDHRARLERIQFEAAERRERALIDQRSPDNTPEMRIRVWERLHQVRLPKDPTHAILPQVAQQTALNLSEILEVQRMRAQPADIAP
jgi:hypothetical protein